MALENDIAAMERNQVQRNVCLSVEALAEQVQTHQTLLTTVVNEIVNQIEVIETGDGVKMVRGLATTEVTGSDFQIDNIVSLTDGFDAPTAPLDVSNVIGFSCPDNHVIYAVLNPTSTEWEGLTVPPNTIRVIYGEATAAVTGPVNSTFTLDTLVTFTPGYTHPTSTQLVYNLFGVDAPEDQRFMAFQLPEDSTWWAFTDIAGSGDITGTTVNLIAATVNQAGGVARSDTTFPFDAASALLGTIVGTTGTAQNDPPDEWFDNEEILLIQADSNNWIPIHKPEPEIVPVLVVDDIPAATIAAGEIEFGTTVDSISVLKLNSAGDAYEADVTADGINITESVIEADSGNPLPKWAWKRREGYALLASSNAKASVVGSYGYLLLDLPASGISGTFPATVTPVTAAVKVIRLTYSGGVFKYEVAQTEDAEPVDLIVDGIGPPDMPINAGIVVPGNLITVSVGDVDVQVFEVQWSDYKYGIPGWTSGNDQSIGHDASGEIEWQDDGECG